MLNEQATQWSPYSWKREQLSFNTVYEERMIDGSEKPNARAESFDSATAYQNPPITCRFVYLFSIFRFIFREC